jgi:hypothetical protein
MIAKEMNVVASRQEASKKERVPPPNTMDQEIASAIKRALFHQKAPAHIQIMHARRNAMVAIRSITPHYAMLAMALVYRNHIITTACTVDRGGVIHVEDNKSWERLTI